MTNFNSSFTSCESGSLFANVQFSETKFEEILLIRSLRRFIRSLRRFIGLILSDLKIKTTTFHDLEFSETYPVRIHKLKKVRQNSFQEILADFYLE